MKINLIGCPFTTSYGAASESLKKALEKKLGDPVEWIASNCGCGDDFELNRQFQMPKSSYKYFDMLPVNDNPSPKRWKRWLRARVAKVVHYFRARKYGQLAAGSEVANFQQTLNAYGSTVLFYWLNQPSTAARVVTIHELDAWQLRNPESNRTYNKADAIIVQQGSMKDQLVGLGVDRDRIEIVLHGTDLPALDENQHREGIVFYGGHHPFKGKGLQAMIKAVALLKSRMGAAAPKLKVHGYFSAEDLAGVKALAAEAGLENDVAYLNQIQLPQARREYASSCACVLPYTGSFAGLAAATSAAVGLPVVATKNAGIIEHLGDNALWLSDDNAEEIAALVEKLLASDELRSDLSKRLRKRAEEFLNWDIIAENTLAVYRRALERKWESAPAVRNENLRSSICWPFPRQLEVLGHPIKFKSHGAVSP